MAEKVVSMFGTGRAKPGDAAYLMAGRLGRLLAEAGLTIANGGYGGTMLAAAEAAAGAGGATIGVTCSAFEARPNRFITREIVTRSLDERLNTLIKLGRAYIVLPGGTGTLLELAKVWELNNKGFLNKGKPIILVGEFWKPLVDLIAGEDPASRNLLYPAGDCDEVTEILLNRI